MVLVSHSCLPDTQDTSYMLKTMVNFSFSSLAPQVLESLTFLGTEETIKIIQSQGFHFFFFF